MNKQVSISRLIATGSSVEKKRRKETCGECIVRILVSLRAAGWHLDEVSTSTACHCPAALANWMPLCLPLQHCRLSCLGLTLLTNTDSLCGQIHLACYPLYQPVCHILWFYDLMIQSSVAEWLRRANLGVNTTIEWLGGRGFESHSWQE